jgi:TctA family transporter
MTFFQYLSFLSCSPPFSVFAKNLPNSYTSAKVHISIALIHSLLQALESTFRGVPEDMLRVVIPDVQCPDVQCPVHVTLVR